ncbi:esterase [Bradyrhizobium sp. CCBAU 051011]|jgi:acetyl esterase/lipase|uniref:alpha/beta hydrolase n=1 Tax=Bradyrhizobium sp. CCBAU 051011 TaxID=858422 RepID=UPI0013739AB4|nr:alpha/beta hydrolase [Bradyrhizobium sp. CCBAU 051011]QHO77504.1 esterase [Bradyrhizobium sp. CCBAU 051011]
MAFSKLVLSLVAVFLASTAAAQQAPMSEDLAWKLLELGRVIDPPKTAALFAPLQQKEPYQGVNVERDVKYGPADRNLLDIFVPETAASPRPVLIYVHAGAFVGGNKRTTPTSPFYDNIMLWAVKNGFIGVNATYRLAPQAPWPAGAEDMATVVKWVTDKIGERGGNPARIYLMGHSAGAVHVASYVSHPEFHKVKGGGLAGAIMISGIYDLTGMSLADGQRAYYGDDPARYAERSSLQGLATTDIPLMMAVAELDPEGFVLQFDRAKQATCKRASGCARALLLPQHSHMSEVYSINAVESPLADEILEFVKTGK